MLGSSRVVEVIVALLHLHVDEIACQGDLANVVTRITLDSHHVSLVQVEVLVVEVISLTSVLELHLYIVTFADILGHIAKPVIDHEFLVLTAVGTEAARIVAVVLICNILIIGHCVFT